MQQKEIQLSDVHLHLEKCSVLPTKGKCIYPGCVYDIKSIADLQHHLATDVIVHSILNTSIISDTRVQVMTQLERYTKSKRKGTRIRDSGK